MYQVEFFAFLPGTEQRVTVFAACNNINDYIVYGLTLRFCDDEGETMHIEYDRNFFSDVEDEANEALLDEYYNKTFKIVQ